MTNQVGLVIEILITKKELDTLNCLAKQLGYKNYREWLESKSLNAHNDALDKMGIEALALGIILR